MYDKERYMRCDPVVILDCSEITGSYQTAYAGER